MLQLNSRGTFVKRMEFPAIAKDLGHPPADDHTRRPNFRPAEDERAILWGCLDRLPGLHDTLLIPLGRYSVHDNAGGWREAPTVIDNFRASVDYLHGRPR